MAFVILFLFASQLAKVGERFTQVYHELHYKAAVVNPSQDKSKIIAKPDVYYVVLDRYGNDTQLKDKFNIDNSQYQKALSDQGLVQRPNAYSNYPFTMSSITSTLSMNYHTELGKKFANDSYQTAFPYRAIFNNPPVAQLLKQNGYTYNQLSSWWDFTRVGIQADNNQTESFRIRIFGKSFYLSDLTRDMFSKSILSTLFQKGITIGHTTLLKSDLNRNPHENLDAQLSALHTIASGDHSKPQFTFTHILVPHPPYVFNADGSDSTYDHESNDNGVDEKVKYANSVTYINSRMEETVSYIRQHDPNAAIVIQADEGPYPKQFRFELSPSHFYKPTDLSLSDMQQKFSVTANYYMPGVSADTVKSQITASVDPFRFILSHYLGYDLPMLPDCQFSTGDKYKVYNYTLVTQQLKGQPAPSACSSL